MSNREKSLATICAIIALDDCGLVAAIPKWARWVARDSTGIWFAYATKPHILGGQWALDDLKFNVTFLRLTANSLRDGGALSELYKI